MDKGTQARLLKNYMNARRSWEGWCFLNNLHMEEENPEIRKYADENKLLFHCRFLLLKDTLIELYKIIKDSGNNRDNIFKLLRASESEEAQSLLGELMSFSIELESITKTRDKFYAHLDEDYAEYSGSFKIEYYYKTFEYIESAIIVLGLQLELDEIWDELPYRDDLVLNISV